MLVQLVFDVWPLYTTRIEICVLNRLGASLMGTCKHGDKKLSIPIPHHFSHNVCFLAITDFHVAPQVPDIYIYNLIFTSEHKVTTTVHNPNSLRGKLGIHNTGFQLDSLYI